MLFTIPRPIVLLLEQFLVKNNGVVRFFGRSLVSKLLLNLSMHTVSSELGVTQFFSKIRVWYS